MERRMTGNCHVRCGAGENSEMISKNYLSLLIKYCPGCLKRNELSCEYGYGAVTPCYIYCGSELIGRVIDSSEYYLRSEKFKLNLKLKETYLNALYEADGIISYMLENNRLKSK